MKKVKVKRTKHIDTRLTEEEFDLIKSKAANTGVTASEYLRSIGMNYPLKSIVDQVALEEIKKLRGDFGRVGGLFKMWLSAPENKTRTLGSNSYQEIEAIVSNIENKQNELLKIAKELLDGS